MAGGSLNMSSSKSPCAACKFLRRKCTNECVFAPYFPADEPLKFANVHKVFGASNITKILNDISIPRREEAVNSLVFEAQYRLHDPVRGCIGYLSELERRLKQVNLDLISAKTELSNLIGPSAFLPILRHPINFGAGPSTLLYHHHQMQMQMQQQQQQQQMMIMDEQVMPGVREREVMRRYEQHQQESRFARFGEGEVSLSPSMALVPYEQQENSSVQQRQAQVVVQQQEVGDFNLNAQFQSEIVRNQPQPQRLDSQGEMRLGPSY